MKYLFYSILISIPLFFEGCIPVPTTINNIENKKVRRAIIDDLESPSKTGTEKLGHDPYHEEPTLW